MGLKHSYGAGTTQALRRYIHIPPAASKHPFLHVQTRLCLQLPGSACVSKPLRSSRPAHRATAESASLHVLALAGEIVPVAGTPFDFTTPRTIGERIEQLPKGYDHNLVLFGMGPQARFITRNQAVSSTWVHSERLTTSRMSST